MELLSDSTRRPMARWLADCEAGAGYDDGDLTATHGFLPRRIRIQPLPSLYRPWEDAALLLPSLAFDRGVRRVLGAIPLLPVGPQYLPDRDLKRAALLLGVIAHSYWRFGVDRMLVSRNQNIDDSLPEAIAAPWEEICRRLGRVGVGLTTEDFFFNNFTLIDESRVGADGEYCVDDIVNSSVRPIFAAYGNTAERVFAAAFVDIHAAMTPVVSAACRLEEAILEKGTPGAASVARDLILISQCVTSTVRAFRRISPCPTSRTYCDPVDWAKTFVTWSVPPPGYPSGPSGSAAPFLHFLDALVGRDRYESQQGRFAKHLRDVQLPRKHGVFFDLLRQLDVRAYVNKLIVEQVPDARQAANAFNAVLESFAGPAGFLGVHKGKVVNYLGVGTLVGRNQSTAHEQTYVEDATWTTMAGRLAEAIGEREELRVAETRGIG